MRARETLGKVEYNTLVESLKTYYPGVWPLDFGSTKEIALGKKNKK